MAKCQRNSRGYGEPVDSSPRYAAACTATVCTIAALDFARRKDILRPAYTRKCTYVRAYCASRIQYRVISAGVLSPLVPRHDARSRAGEARNHSAPSFERVKERVPDPRLESCRILAADSSAEDCDARFIRRGRTRDDAAPIAHSPLLAYFIPQ